MVSISSMTFFFGLCLVLIIALSNMLMWCFCCSYWWYTAYDADDWLWLRPYQGNWSKCAFSLLCWTLVLRCVPRLSSAFFLFSIIYLAASLTVNVVLMLYIFCVKNNFPSHKIHLHITWFADFDSKSISLYSGSAIFLFSSFSAEGVQVLCWLASALAIAIIVWCADNSCCRFSMVLLFTPHSWSIYQGIWPWFTPHSFHLR